MPNAKNFFSDDEKKKIAAAIEEAERNTSGEIRVHIEEHCKGNLLDRAVKIFAQLKMHETQLHNGVLFYLAVKDHEFAVIGDKGINTVVPAHFWDNIKEHVLAQFKEQKFTEGLCQGIEMAGQQLKQHFPYRADDSNELTNEVSFNP